MKAMLSQPMAGKLADIDGGVVEWGVQVTAEIQTKSVATVNRNKNPQQRLG